jgi:hypothetical protein
MTDRTYTIDLEFWTCVNLMEDIQDFLSDIYLRLLLGEPLDDLLYPTVDLFETTTDTISEYSLVAQCNI